MKNVVLASVLSAVAGALVAPRIGGPVHYQVTQPHALYCEITSGTTSLGTLPVDFVLQDVVVGGNPAFNVVVKVNTARAFACQVESNNSGFSLATHLNGGVFIPAGSVIEVEGQSAYPGSVSSITLSGYVQ